MKHSILSMRLQQEHDLVSVRQRARETAALLGFEAQDQTRVATAVSEIARNAVRYAAGGRAEFAIEGQASPQIFSVTVSDSGPGIKNLTAVLQGRYKSETGMGFGLQGARKLMDRFHVETAPGKGTIVTLGKMLPKRAAILDEVAIGRIAGVLAQTEQESAYDELQRQNRELLRALDELRIRQEELAAVNRELEDTNRGVVALYAELDEKAEHLRKADRLKSTFLSHMSHEFRTPLNSVIALSQILLNRMDGPLTEEQEKQVGYIHRAAQELTDLVNDLLDLAKVEAGKIELHPSHWRLDSVLGTLRGMMRPLVANSPVQIVFDEAREVPELFQDESKVAQILRNFVSNAIKFTERGEIRISTWFEEPSGMVCISVADTGIGIAPEDQVRIFDQYVQVNRAQHRKMRGTGLGLSLSKKLAELLGGGITLESELGRGSTFTLRIPPKVEASDDRPASVVAKREIQHGAAGFRILVVDDEEVARYLVRKQLADMEVELIEVQTAADAVRQAIEQQPDLIVLDLVMRGGDGFSVLDDLRGDSAAQAIPVIIHTSKVLQEAEYGRLAGRAEAIVSKTKSEAGELRRVVERLLSNVASET
jgi:signal transduction histidine kinase